MLEQIEKAFAQELLSVSPKASELVDFAWTVYNIGGTVPVNVVEKQFEKSEQFVSMLSKAGIIRYAMGGFINRDEKKLSVSVTLSEEMQRHTSKGMRRKEFENIIFRNHGDKLIPSCRTGLTEALSVMLTSIIFYATPDKPAFVNTVIRRTAKSSMKTQVECQEMLDYYLHKFLGLVSMETGSLLNLSVRSQQRARMNPKIWEIYVRPYQDKEQPKQEEIRKPVVEAKPPPTKASEQEKRLRGYFPWLKL